MKGQKDERTKGGLDSSSLPFFLSIFISLLAPRHSHAFSTQYI